MIIIFLFLFYFSPSSTTASPLIDAYGNIVALNACILASGGPPACTCPDQRSIWDIVWSCLATIFACTWISVHPDIPDPDEKWWMIVARRVELVIWTLLAPELIIYWAMSQWWGARMIAREQKDKGWGETHGYFMEMGGFMLYKGDQKMGTLSYFRLEELLAKNRIEFPTTTEEEIKDRSKSDGLSKLLVIGQTAWFILQCITRRVEKLPITELELATLAFAALNGMMYFFWWNKPFDVRSPVPVGLRKDKLDKAIDARTDTSKMDENKSSQEKADKEVISQYEGRPITEDNQKSEMSALVSKDADLNATEMHVSYGQTVWFKAATIPWTALKVIGRRLDVIFVGQGDFSEFNNPKRPEEEIGPMRVPTFYSLVTSDGFLNGVVVFVIGSIFGAIHCAGWFFHFPTTAELWIWRISSLNISIFPILTPVIFMISRALEHWEHSESPTLRALYNAVFFIVGSGILSVGLFMYPVSRFLLLAECLTTLRDLPPGAYDVVQWTIRIPHI